jgi:hypothetical protein
MRVSGLACRVLGRRVVEQWRGPAPGRRHRLNLRLTPGRLTRLPRAAGPGRPDAAAPAGEPHPAFGRVPAGPEPRCKRGDPGYPAASPPSPEHRGAARGNPHPRVHRGGGDRGHRHPARGAAPAGPAGKWRVKAGWVAHPRRDGPSPSLPSASGPRRAPRDHMHLSPGACQGGLASLVRPSRVASSRHTPTGPACAAWTQGRGHGPPLKPPPPFLPL